MTETVKPQLAAHDRCTGCGACASGCPKGAIHMVRDKEGFLYPQITDGCVSCGHCAHVCPVLKQREVRGQSAVFAVWNEDSAVCAHSTAGFSRRWRTMPWSAAAWCSARRWMRSSRYGTWP